jgi:hypothetical protein
LSIICVQMKRRMLRLFTSVVVLSAVMHAHHSLSGSYDMSREVSIEGRVTQFQFINPHPFLTVSVESAGKTQQWRLEMDNRFELTEIGITGETLKPGDRVTVKGSPGHSQGQILYIRRLDRPADGFWYEQVGSTPKASIPRKP